MAKKDAYYFAHDCNARHDPKIIKRCTKFGLEGYGFYFCLLEIMRESADYSINLTDLETVAYQLHLSIEKVNDLINYCIAIKLLISNGNQVYSESFIDRMQSVDDMRKKQSENGKKGGRPKNEENPNESQNKPNENPNESLKGEERKGDKIKGEEREEINKDKTIPAPPTQDRDFLLWEYFQKQATKLLKEKEKLHEIKAPQKFEHYLEVLQAKDYKNPEAAIKKWIHTDIEQIIEVVS